MRCSPVEKGKTMSDLKADGKVIKSEFFYSNKLGWYAMLQILLRGEDFFIAQQLPQKVTCGWERWIPASERLPEDGEVVLVWCKIGKMFVGYRRRLYGDNWYWYILTARDSTKHITYKVTHWMPLPEPPKEEKNNG